MQELVFDGLRVAHMAAFAIGIGGAAFLELQLAHRFRKRVEIDGLRLLLFGHDLIRLAVVVLWITGLGLLAMRLGIFGGAFSAKLAAKLVVVSLLTANMFLIDRFLIPEIFIFEGARLSEIPGETRAQFGAVGGLSAGCWVAALLLGGISAFKAMPAAELAVILIPIVSGAAMCGAVIAWLAGRRGPDPMPHAVPGE